MKQLTYKKVTCQTAENGVAHRVVWQPKCRAGPVLFHTRDGPQWYQYISTIGPPQGTGPPGKRRYDKEGYG